MPGNTIDFDTVRRIGLGLPDVEESPGALKVHGKLLAFIPRNRSAEPNSIVVRVDPDVRAHLIAEAPGVYYVTDHYSAHNAVLVRLSSISPEVLRDLLGMAHRFVTRNTRSRARSRKGRSRGPGGKPVQP